MSGSGYPQTNTNSSATGLDSPEVSSKSGPGSSPDTPTRNMNNIGGSGSVSGGGHPFVDMGHSPYGFAPSPYGAFRPILSHPSAAPQPYQHPVFPGYFFQQPNYIGKPNS
jgi:hypothetical protein